MTQLADRPNTALLVIDVQNDVVAAAYNRDRVVAAINRSVTKARAAGAPVIWVQHDDEELPSGTDAWKIVDELVPQPGEPVVYKNFRDSFQTTVLEEVLADRGIGKLVMTGAQSDYCVRWTLHGALTRGYDTVLISDAHTTDETSPGDLPDGAEVVAQLNSIWGTQANPLCSTEVLAEAEITFD